MTVDPHRAAICPVCQALLAASTRQDASPAPGDLAVCVYCGTVLTFGDELVLHVASPELLASLPDDVRAELERVERAVGERLSAQWNG